MTQDNLTPYQRRQQSLFKVSPWFTLDPSTKTVDYETQEKRYRICQECPELIKLTRQCKKNGAFMDVKTKVEDATCPLEKW